MSTEAATTARRLPPPPPEVPCVCSLDGLAPKFRVKVVQLQDAMVARGLARPKVSESTRTDARQAYLYGFGRRYDDGRGIVTACTSAETSWHGYGLAVDLVHPTLEWSAPPSYFDAIGEEARKLGLRWGGDWHHPDRPHVQWGAPMRDSPSDHGMDLFEAGNIAEVWREVGAA